jgi:hypothetical protein
VDKGPAEKECSRLITQELGYGLITAVNVLGPWSEDISNCTDGAGLFASIENRWPRLSKINGLSLQTWLTARIGAKGVSGALTNLSSADRAKPLLVSATPSLDVR